MHVYVIIATKGRAKETQHLLDHLRQQTFLPTFTLIVGSEVRDLEGLQDHPLIKDGLGEAILSPRLGLTAQRNFGIETLERLGCFAPEKGRFMCVFFDDDYRPDQDWLKQAHARMSQGDIVGLTGHVLADGVATGALTEEQVPAYIDGDLPPQPHWASGTHERIIDSVYGCNMAFIDNVIRAIRFDENLPFYGWQEDRDYTGMAKEIGNSIYFSGCRGVHLGAKSGRISGIRYGYSQIANPLYLMKKGTMGYKNGVRIMAMNFVSNIVHSLANNRPSTDYPGRLKGNWCAICDAICLRSDPRKIIAL